MKNIKIKRSKGQIIIGALAIILVAGILLIMLFNNGLALREKTRLVNAADAVAYSEGVITARRLNFLAYTNRSVLVNHLAAGHAVSYMSWLRYITTTWQANPQFYNYGLLPQYPNLSVRVFMGFALPSAVNNLPGSQANITQFLQSITAANAALAAAQANAAANTLAVNADVVNNTAAAFNLPGEAANPIRINNPQDLTNTIALANNIGDNALANELGNINNGAEDAALIGFVQMANNSANFLQMTNNAIDINNPNQIPSGHWFNARDWRTDPGVGNGRIRNFATNTAGADWQANDSVTSDDGAINYAGQASALALDPSYAPFANNHATLPNNAAGRPATPTLTRTVLAAKTLNTQDLIAATPGDRNLTGLRSFDTIEHRNDQDNLQAPIVLTAYSRAQVFYQRPQPGLLDNFAFANIQAGQVEFANLYNPFWQVRLVSVPTTY